MMSRQSLALWLTHRRCQDTVVLLKKYISGSYCVLSAYYGPDIVLNSTNEISFNPATNEVDPIINFI